MSIAKWPWKPRDVERAIKVVRKAGLSVTGVTISTKGDITVATGTPLDGDNSESPNPWDTDHAADKKWSA
jgi:hypothetical protein